MERIKKRFECFYLERADTFGKNPNSWRINCLSKEIKEIYYVLSNLRTTADFVLKVDYTHYGRVEEANLSICNMICYSFIQGLDNLRLNRNLMNL